MQSINFSLVVLMLLACNSIEPGQKNGNVNAQLAADAKLGKICTESSLIVITENNIRLIGINEINKDTIYRTIKRGCVLKDFPFKYAPANFRLVNYPGDSTKWYLNKDAAHFRQYLPGMCYPVEGIVENNETTIRYFNKKEKRNYDLKLKKGEVYYWVIRKADHYVNVLLDTAGNSITGVLSEDKCHILQSEDHLKIVSEVNRKKLLEAWK